MRKFLSVMLLCLPTIFLSAQTKKLSVPSQAFKDYSIKLEDNRRAASDKKDYLRADTLLKQWTRTYDALPDSVKNDFRGWESGMYYNIACYDALLGNKKDALTAFEKCAKLGYNNYTNTIADTDLESLHKEKRYLAALELIRERGDMGYVLRKSGTYNHTVNKDLPVFTYQEANDADLIAFKNKFKLDSVAGNRDEISKIKNLLLWVHNTVRHDGNSNNPALKNGIDLIEVCKKENRGINCRMMATILKDAYQAEGFKARMVTCMPKDTLDNDCHVITVVWAGTLNKWVWMDPTFNAYVTDKSGNLLNIEEVRNKLYNNQLTDLVLNDDANWNNQNKQSREYYLGYYMSKNLYWLQCSAKSEWNVETNKPDKPATEYINLYPTGYNNIKAPKRMVRSSIQYATNNPETFWQKPVAVN
ncbi:TPR end-of-group domain-containing protein [Mucilaginibacter celer]|uniref:Transglutaminase domain-containing protein n=1 Tax=Mucilaginibacter celer TaxID=2305508 RepID=A0A494VR47_9SPHI|nr:transglutaminase domain-containing protein [Mucilaginibacter celer]AYL93825.1 transglutaminase domain-containing protein [Mucilaginibacter celer]